MKIFTGKVISTKQTKTATVEVEMIFRHPLYGKRMKRNKTYHVHDDLGLKSGDVVRFVGTRPISKTKRWKVTEIVGQKGEKSK